MILNRRTGSSLLGGFVLTVVAVGLVLFAVSPMWKTGTDVAVGAFTEIIDEISANLLWYGIGIFIAATLYLYFFTKADDRAFNRLSKFGRRKG